MIIAYSIKPAGGGGGFTPASLSNKWAWWDASQEAYSNNANTTLWTDWFSLSHDMPRYPAQGATYHTNILNSKAVFNFPGTNDVMQYGSSITFSDPATIIIVARWANTGKALIANSHGIYEGSGSAHIESYGGTYLNGPAQDTNVWHKMYSVFQSGSSNGKFYVDGTKYTGTNGAMDNGALWVGYSNFGLGFSGDIAEVVILQGSISDADAANLDTYYNTKYGI